MDHRAWEILECLKSMAESMQQQAESMKQQNVFLQRIADGLDVINAKAKAEAEVEVVEVKREKPQKFSLEISVGDEDDDEVVVEKSNNNVAKEVFVDEEDDLPQFETPTQHRQTRRKLDFDEPRSQPKSQEDLIDWAERTESRKKSKK